MGNLVNKPKRMTYLVRKEIIVPTDEQALVLRHMSYAASKLWNVANYERKHWKELELKVYPNWYDQKKRLKTNLFYKNLPSQTAQKVLKKLDESWASFYALQTSGGVKNPKPPRYKRDKMYVTFVQNGIKIVDKSTLRLSIPKQLKAYLRTENGLEAHYLFLKIGRLSGLRDVKEVQISFMDDGRLKLFLVHEAEVPDERGNNGRYLSIDLGLKNNFTCYDSANVETFILSGLFAKTHWFDKEIARLQSISDAQRGAEGEQHPKKSSRILNLYKRKNNIRADFLHKSTRFLVDYCVHHNLNTIVVGDWTKICEKKDGSAKNWGANGNAKLHSFPYLMFYKLMRYKCALVGIRFIVRSEAWTSQCPPDSLGITRKFAEKSKRIFRGMYRHNGVLYNADAVGAFNILRKFLLDEELASNKINATERELFSLRAPKRVHVA